MASHQPIQIPDPTTVPGDQSDKPPGDAHTESLKKEYDKLAAAVQETAPNTPERHRAMEAKKVAFKKYNDAAAAHRDLTAAVAQADQKQAAAESAARDAQAAKKAAAAAGKQHGGTHAASEPDAGTSPVSESSATDAVDQVGRMTSRDKLQAIADHDTRASVKAAAQARLGQL